MTQKNQHGGKRSGAGRPPSDKRKVRKSFSLDPEIAAKKPTGALVNASLRCVYYSPIGTKQPVERTQESEEISIAPIDTYVCDVCVYGEQGSSRCLRIGGCEAKGQEYYSKGSNHES